MRRLIGSRLVVARKVTAYLLDATHPDGAPKAGFFTRFGFSAANPETLIAALSAHPDANDIVAVVETEHGRKTMIQCQLATPDGRNPCIRTVWMRDRGSVTHRFVTAYPAVR